jgi:hypothetical protein
MRVVSDPLTAARRDGHIEQVVPIGRRGDCEWPDLNRNLADGAVERQSDELPNSTALICGSTTREYPFHGCGRQSTDAAADGVI